MGKKTLFLLAVAMLLMLSSQARAQVSPKQSVDLTTRKAKTTHDGLRMVKNLPFKKVDARAVQTDAATVQTTPADKKRDAVVKTKAQEAAAVSKVKDKKETAIKKMAHHPAVKPGLKRQGAPQRAGVVRDGYGMPIEDYPYLNTFQTVEEQEAFMIIDANDDLSIQVHPDDHLAQQRGMPFGKTEMWYVIESDPGATIVDGFSRQTTPEQYQQHLQQGNLEQLLHLENTQAGDTFFIPAGRVHAIGKGNLFAEI